MDQDKAGNLRDVWEIMEHYRVRKNGKEVINHAVEDRVFKRLANIPPEKRARVIDWLLGNHPRNFGLDLMAINEAETHDRGYDTPYVAAEKVTCECCGLVYQYKMCVSDDDKLKRGIFTHCPRCGHKYEDTLREESYFRQTGERSAIHLNELRNRLENWIAGGQKWFYNRDEELRWIQDLESKDAERRRAYAAEQEKWRRDIAERLHAAAHTFEAVSTAGAGEVVANE